MIDMESMVACRPQADVAAFLEKGPLTFRCAGRLCAALILPRPHSLVVDSSDATKYCDVTASIEVSLPVRKRSSFRPLCLPDLLAHADVPCASRNRRTAIWIY